MSGCEFQGSQSPRRPSAPSLTFVSVVSLLLGGCNAVVTKAIVSNQSGTIESALKEGKAVLIAKKTIYEPSVGSTELVKMSGEVRPPLTYWQHRTSKTTLVVGGETTKEGRGKLFTQDYHFFILEPGIYDLLGYVQKTRMLSNLYSLPKATKPIRSSLGLVKFSGTTLPQLYTYLDWVPPQAAGTTIDGNVVTQWYTPGHYVEKVDSTQISAGFVDMRGMAAFTDKGDANLASFMLKPGQIALIGDFDMEFTHGKCDWPEQNLWVCPIVTLTLQPAVVDLHGVVQKEMEQYGYPFDLIRQMTTATVLPGHFFKLDKPQPGSLRGYVQMKAVTTVQ